MCVTVAKVERSDKKQTLQRLQLPNINVLVQVIGVLESENRKVGQGALTFCEGQGHNISSRLPCRIISSYMTVHDDVVVPV